MLFHRTACSLGLACLALVACQSTPTHSVLGPDSRGHWTSYVPDLPVSEPPFDQVFASWKQRLDQPYVFLEHRGSYTEVGALIPLLQREMIAQQLEPAGPPFALFYDDPGRTRVEDLRARVGIPVAGERSPQEPLQYDVLPSTTVVYAVVSGPYPDVPRSYPGVFDYLSRQGWVENGPLREIYLVPPGSVKTWKELLTEVQIPAAAAP